MLLGLLEFDKRLKAALAQFAVNVLECPGSRASWYIIQELAALGFTVLPDKVDFARSKLVW